MVENVNVLSEKNEEKELKTRVFDLESRLNSALLQLENQNKRIKELESCNKDDSVEELWHFYEDLQDRLYEIDKSWKNNLLFFGIKPDPGGTYESQDCIENKIKFVLKNNLNIARDIPIIRAQRIHNGIDARGFKPIIINFQRWSDKEEILRKSKILKVSGIHVEEDYSRAAKSRRKELEKLVKEVRSLSPEKKCVFKYDRLIIDDNVYIYNEREGRIERLPQGSNGEEDPWDTVSHSTTPRRTFPNRPRNLSRSKDVNLLHTSRRSQSIESFLEKIPSRNNISLKNNNFKNEKFA